MTVTAGRDSSRCRHHGNTEGSTKDTSAMKRWIANAMNGVKLTHDTCLYENNTWKSMKIIRGKAKLA